MSREEALPRAAPPYSRFCTISRVQNANSLSIRFGIKSEYAGLFERIQLNMHLHLTNE